MRPLRSSVKRPGPRGKNLALGGFTLLCLLGCSSPSPEPRQVAVGRAGQTPASEVARAQVPARAVQTPTPARVKPPIASPSQTPARTPTPDASVAFSAKLLEQPLPDSRLALTLPGPVKPRAANDAALSALLTQAETSKMAAHWRKVGERALKLELFAQASQAFRQEVGIYRAKGIVQAALAQEARAAQYSTQLSLYLSRPAPVAAKAERLEPAAGCYVGAFVDRDDNLKKFNFASQTHGDVDEFNGLVGKDHASFFMYRSYGQPFPRQWAEYLKERGAIVHIAWEPKRLADVRDDAYLREFVDQMVELDHPVMLRFASEMNGEWTPYHGDPAAYKTAFRLVHKATRRAPKAAMMWCPNTVPRQGLEAYYPGDDAVDWVGVNFYSVPFLDNDRSRPGEKIHPTDHLQAVYDLYSARKPIAVGEWAASRQSSASPKPLTEFAKTKISQLYSALPTRYPRVKMVNWYDSNNLREASPARQLNNYQVTAPRDLLAQYSKAVSSSYFLGAGERTAAMSYKPLFGRAKIDPGASLRIALKSYDQRPKVYFRVNGAMVLATDEALDWQLPPRVWKVGKNVVDVFVYDSKNRFITQARAVLELPHS